MRRSGRREATKRLSEDLRAPQAVLLGEHEMIYRALQIGRLRSKRLVEAGALSSAVVGEIGELMLAVDGRQSAKEYLERGEMMARRYQLPQAVSLTGVLEELRCLMEVGGLSRDSEARRLFRVLPAITRLNDRDEILKGLSFFKGRMLWDALRYARDPGDPRNAGCKTEIGRCADIFAQGAARYLQTGTVFEVKHALMLLLREQYARRDVGDEAKRQDG